MRLPLRAGVLRLAASRARPFAQCLNAAICPSMSWASGTVCVMASRNLLGSRFLVFGVGLVQGVDEDGLEFGSGELLAGAGQNDGD